MTKLLNLLKQKKNLTAEDERNLRKAEYLNNKSRELLDAGSKYGDESGIHNWVEGLSNDLFDRDIIAGVGLVRDIKIGNLVKKLNDGEQLSESENALLVASLNLEDVRYARSFDLATGYKIGQGTAQSVPFMIDMLVTNGLSKLGASMLIKSLKVAGWSKTDDLARLLGGTKGVNICNPFKGERVMVGALEDGAEKKLKDYAIDVTREAIGTPLQTYAMPSSWRMREERHAT